MKKKNKIIELRKKEKKKKRFLGKDGKIYFCEGKEWVEIKDLNWGNQNK